jgi:hypothetical protein
VPPCFIDLGWYALTPFYGWLLGCFIIVFATEYIVCLWHNECLWWRCSADCLHTGNLSDDYRDTPGSEGDPVSEDQWEARKFHLLWAYDLPFFGAPKDETQLRSVMKCYDLLWGRMRIGPLPTHIICDNILLPWLRHSRYLRSNWGFTPKDLGYSKVRSIDSQVFHQGPGVVSSPWPDCCIGYGKRLHNYGKSPFLWENSLWMAIFNSYVKFEWCWPCHVFRLWLRYLYLFTSVAMRWAAPRTPWAIVISAFNFFLAIQNVWGCQTDSKAWSDYIILSNG